MSATHHSHRFPAMGSEVELVLVGGTTSDAARAVCRAAALAEEWEATFSRFRSDSELSRLNARAGSRTVTSGRLFDGVAAAVAASRATGGLFDPTILPALVALGYDRTFVSIPARPLLHEAPSVAPGVNAIVLEPDAPAVTLPEGVAIDLGGIAKGLYADALALELSDWSGGIVSAGGDLRVWGKPDCSAGWQVGIEDPGDPQHDLAVVMLAAGGVATSGTNRRSWQLDGQLAHHLIDPRTGRPAMVNAGSVTVVAADATTAEIVSTALAVAGCSSEAAARLTHVIPFDVALAVFPNSEVRVLYDGKEVIDGPTSRAA